MRNNGVMSDPALAPRNAVGGVVAVWATAFVATVAVDSWALTGTDTGSAKVSAFSEFPPKGRATGGVRAQRFLKGETALGVAWVGPGPAHALEADGSVAALPDSGMKRDGSGVALAAPVASIGAAPEQF